MHFEKKLVAQLVCCQFVQNLGMTILLVFEQGFKRILALLLSLSKSSFLSFGIESVGSHQLHLQSFEGICYDSHLAARDDLFNPLPELTLQDCRPAQLMEILTQHAAVVLV